MVIPVLEYSKEDNIPVIDMDRQGEEQQLFAQGGPGSGHHDHEGRPGKVGGSAPRGTSTPENIPLKPSEGYIEKKALEIREWVNKNNKGFADRRPEIEAGYSIAFRGDAGDLEATYAMLEYMEQNGIPTETALRVMGYQGNWTGNVSGSYQEWVATQELGSSVPLPKDVIAGAKTDWRVNKELPKLSEEEVKAFRLRLQFTQAYFRDKYPEGLTVYRGVRGPYAKKIAKVYDEREMAIPFSERENRVTPPVRIPVYALSSYSPDRSLARGFASTKRGELKGIVFKRTITADQVWMMPRELGVGSPIKFIDDAGEIVSFDSDGFEEVEIYEIGDIRY